MWEVGIQTKTAKSRHETETLMPEELEQILIALVCSIGSESEEKLKLPPYNAICLDGWQTVVGHIL